MGKISVNNCDFLKVCNFSQGLPLMLLDPCIRKHGYATEPRPGKLPYACFMVIYVTVFKMTIFFGKLLSVRFEVSVSYG
jgi:hypothetical protein